MEPEIVKTTITPLKDLLPEIYGDALKPGMKAVGHAIGDALEMCLLPITAMGYVPKLAKKCLDKHLKTFEHGFAMMDKAIEDNDSNGYIKGNAEIQKTLGYYAQFRNQKEFDELMDSDINFKL